MSDISSPVIEPFEDVSAFASVPEAVAAEPPQPPVQHRRSLEDIYAGVREIYLWLVSQSPTNAVGIGGGLGFLHGCIWCLLFPRFTSFLLFLLASSLTALAGLAYRDVEMTPRQRDSITVCGGVFGILSVLMFFIWVMA